MGWTVYKNGFIDTSVTIHDNGDGTADIDFPKNTGGTPITYYVEYKVGSNCGRMPISQPAGCGGGGDTCTGLDITEARDTITVPQTGLTEPLVFSHSQVPVTCKISNKSFTTAGTTSTTIATLPLEGGTWTVQQDSSSTSWLTNTGLTPNSITGNIAPNEGDDARQRTASFTATCTNEQVCSNCYNSPITFTVTQAGKQSPSSDVERWLSQLVCEQRVPCSNSISNPITITIKVKNAYSYDMLYNGRFHMPLQEIEGYTDKGVPIHYSFDPNTRHAWCDRGSARFSYCDDTNLILRADATLEWTTQIDGKYLGKHIDMSQNPRLYMGVTDLNGEDHYIHAISYPDMGAYLTLDSGISTTISNNGTYSFTLTGTPSYKYDGEQAFHKDEGKAGYLKHVGSSGTVRLAPISIQYWNNNYNG